MHILLIGYLYVIAMIAATSDSLLRGGLFLLFMGVLPAWLLLWRMRRKQQARSLGTQARPAPKPSSENKPSA